MVSRDHLQYLNEQSSDTIPQIMQSQSPMNIAFGGIELRTADGKDMTQKQSSSQLDKLAVNPNKTAFHFGP